MTARGQLASYLTQVERRLRRHAWLRGLAALAASALLMTVLLVVVANRYAFSDGSLWTSRAILFVVLALGIALGLAVPLWRLTRRRAARTAEAAVPDFDQRLITFAERDAQGKDPFLELLADDTLRVARKAEPRTLVPDANLMTAMGVGVASLGVLVWLIMAGPGYLGYGAAMIWMNGKGSQLPLYDLQIAPGNATVRKNSDQLITATPIGLQAEKVQLFARYDGTSKWSEISMRPQQGGSGYQFLFAGLPAGVEYYVIAGPLTSKHYNLRVVDVASVKQIRVTYHYPAWTGMPPSTDDHGGDIHALQGTQADLEVVTDRPLTDGRLVVDDKQIQLAGGENNVYHASVSIDKDGTYHVGTLDRGDPVRLSEDYFIEADKPNAPQVALNRPGQDYQASPIEEVTVAAKADDDFGLTGLALHYSVNGGPEQTVDLLKQKGAKSAAGDTTLSMETFKAVPGDVVSVYATAKDAHQEARTDMYFIQAEPFEREFSQSQQMGGGGGGGVGNSGAEISQREKEIIGSTWKQLGDKDSGAAKAAENAKFLSDVQSKLRAQAQSLTGRAQSRDLPSTNQEFSSFEQDMNSAAQAMGPASEKLQRQQWKDALPDEQKALQFLLRAEATFRQIQVAFGGRGGGGGGGGAGSAGRDLASLFDLELDTAKNQYETAQTAQNSQDQRAQQIDDALKKLDELAQRQEDLAGRNNNSSQQPQDRYQQEMLRREAEQLQQQIQQLAQNSQQGNSNSSQSANGSSSSTPSSSSSSSSASGNDQARARQALDQLRQANEDMRNANQQPGGADARRAADRLRQAQDALRGMQQQQSAGALDGLANEADRLASQEQAQASRLSSLEQVARSLQSGNGTQEQYAKAEDELQRLQSDRQKQADDLANLEQGLRDEQRKAVSSDRQTASRLRDALSHLDENDLQTRIQRSADRMRSGYVPTDDTTEQQILSGMQQLSQQVRQAQQGAVSAQNQGGQSDLDRVTSLRNRLEALDRNFSSDGLNRQGQAGQNGQQGRQGQNGANGGNGQTGARNGGAYGDNRGNGGPVIDNRGGGYGGGDNFGNQWVDTGNNTDPNAPRVQSGPTNPMNPADAQQAIDQGLNDLNQLRQSAGNDPETKAQVDALIKELSNLDPRRFPGNPAMVEELHNKVLNDVDRLELQLRSKSDQASDQPGQVRSSDPMPVPSGYQDAVAEYFRRLSKNP